MKQSMRTIALAVGVGAALAGVPALADNVSVAKQQFDAGTKAYDLGHYDEASRKLSTRSDQAHCRWRTVRSSWSGQTDRRRDGSGFRSKDRA
jgi:hypothetical protein